MVTGDVANQQPAAVTPLWARNFRRLCDVRLEISPQVTALVGTNAAGNSNTVDNYWEAAGVMAGLNDGVTPQVVRRPQPLNAQLRTEPLVSSEWNRPCPVERDSMHNGYVRGKGVFAGKEPIPLQSVASHFHGTQHGNRT